MYKIKNKITALLIMFATILVSCQDLEELNINPNGVDPANAHPNLLMATVITETGKRIVDLGFGDIAGVMQHTQKDGWSGGHNSYDWGSKRWSSYYGILRNTEELYSKAEELDLDFHKGVSMVIEAYAFGLIADLWGDAPYTNALKGEVGGEENLKPKFDSQEVIYNGILATLDTANMLLSKGASEYEDIDRAQDVLYQGDPAKWRKFANSLALRYYMRLSAKSPAIAEAGIRKITADPSNYPIITDASDDALMNYEGNSSTDSWPANVVFDGTSGSDYRRKKMCSTLVEKLQALGDPRLALWANKIDIPIVIDAALPGGSDDEVDGVRYVSQDIADEYESTFGFPIDQDPEYVGLPPAWSIVPQAYNLNPNLEQAPYNPHASHLNDIYKDASGQLLKSRMMSAAEVHFILAEAAFYGWVADAQTHYNAGVEQSLIAWGVGGSYNTYISGAPYVGLDEIIEQKWIASWTAAAESWFDYRRTGKPALLPGTNVKRDAIPLRFYYSLEETELNGESIGIAIDKLVRTAFTDPDVSNNSAWSKSWLLQGTGFPY